MTTDRAVDDKIIIDEVPSKQDHKKDEPTMQVTVHSPFRIYYDGAAYSLTAENLTGVFDVLPQHRNFISLLLPCDLILRTADRGDLKVRIDGGILHVKQDQATVFLDV